MAIETSNDNICINQIIEQKKENFIIEEDSIIPDIKPDILSTIDVSGTVCLHRKEILDKKIKIEGCINTYIIYISDDEKGNIRSINTNIDFVKVIDVEKANSEMILETNVDLKNIECRVINGRKINIKAILDLEFKISSNKDIDIIDDVNLKDIQKLNKKLRISSLIGKGETKVYAKDTVTINNIDNLAEIMKVDARIINKDIRISYNKVLAKADMNIKILYLTEDNRVNTIEAIIPVMGFIDIENISENDICDIQYEIKNLMIKPNNVEEHSIYIESEIQLYCRVYKIEEINLIQDLYSPSTNLKFVQKQIRVMQPKITTQKTESIRENVEISDLYGKKIYDVSVKVEILKQILLKSKVLYEGEILLDFIYESLNNNIIDTKKVKIPFNFNLDFEGVDDNFNIKTEVEISMQDFVVTSDNNIDVKIDLNLTISAFKATYINIIDEINEEENSLLNYCSMVIYFTKSGDTLWKIAKNFGSTIEEIVRVNGIEENTELNIGKQLFIPRYSG